MAESEAGAGGGTTDGVEGGGAARAMMGGSLPPRKRLLAGLKQNGSWLAACTHASPTSPTSVHRPEGGNTFEDAAVEEVSPTLSTGERELKRGCMSCGAVESSAWRRVKRNGVVQRLCNFCALSFNKNMNCPHCLVVYPEVKDPSIWLQCRRCQRSVHVECEKKSFAPTVLDADSYVCLDCLHVKNHKEHSNAFLGARAKRCLGGLGVTCSVGAGNCASSGDAECSSKKLRVLREPRSKSNAPDAEDARKFEGTYNDNKTGLTWKVPISQENAAAAAAAAATLAGRAAAAAKAYAAAKAATAVKAATAAKAALDAAALAARAEAQARVELRKSLVSSEQNVFGVSLKHEAILSELRKERSEKSEVKIEGNENLLPISATTSIDDEELARQLHRAINSSPRISRALTPLCTKLSGKAGASACAADAVISWSRPGLSSAIEPSPQSKQLQTKPRSIYQKEVKRMDCRVVKYEVKMCDGKSCQVPSQRPGCASASDTTGQLVALKSEPADSSTVTLVRQNPSIKHCQDPAITSSDAIIKTEVDEVPRTVGPVLFGTGANQSGRLSTIDVSQAAALLDEVLMSEADPEEAAEEEYFATLTGGMSPHLNESAGVPASVVADDVVSRIRAPQHEDDERKTDREGGLFYSDVATLDQVASTAMEMLAAPSSSESVTTLDGHWMINGGGNSFKTLRMQEDFGPLTRREPSPGSEPSSGKHARGASDSENGQTWEECVVKGMPGDGQGLPGTLHITPFSSATSIPLCSPALAIGSTTKHP